MWDTSVLSPHSYLLTTVSIHMTIPLFFTRQHRFPNNSTLTKIWLYLTCLLTTPKNMGSQTYIYRSSRWLLSIMYFRRCLLILYYHFYQIPVWQICSFLMSSQVLFKTGIFVFVPWTPVVAKRHPSISNLANPYLISSRILRWTVPDPEKQLLFTSVCSKTSSLGTSTLWSPSQKQNFHYGKISFSAVNILHKSD